MLPSSPKSSNISQSFLSQLYHFLKQISRFTYFLFFSYIISLALSEFFIYYIGQITPRFYSVILSTSPASNSTSNNENSGPNPNPISLLFLSLEGIGWMFGAAIFKSLSIFIGGRFALGLRCDIYDFVHMIYCEEPIVRETFNGKENNYQLSIEETGDQTLLTPEEGTQTIVDNPDQRLTTDLQLLTEKTTQLVNSLALLPFLLPYYSLMTFSTLGRFSVLIIYAYTICSFSATYLGMRRLRLFVKDVEKSEGIFRFEHMKYRMQNEQEQSLRIKDEMKNVKKTRIKVLFQTYWMDLLITFFSDLAGIMTYLILAISIWTHTMPGISDSPDTDSGEIAKRISLGSFYAGYLIYKCMSLIGILEVWGYWRGYFDRVQELITFLQLKKDKDSAIVE